MPERKHNLPTALSRLDNQITGPVLDSIVINPRSRGILYMPGEYSTSSRAPAHRVEKTSTDPDNQGVYHEQIQRGSAERYTVSYDVWNYRDSASFAKIILTDQAEKKADTPAAGTDQVSPKGAMAGEWAGPRLSL